jgi:hypothetical protein
MAEARPSFFDFDVTKMITDFRFRPFDVEAMMACQRRNIEAFSQANQLAVEGAQAVARRQIEMARQAFEDVSFLFRELAQPASAEDRIAKNTEYAKQMRERDPRRIPRDGKAASCTLTLCARPRPCRGAALSFTANGSVPAAR